MAHKQGATKKKKYDDWEIEEAVRTMVRAKEIKNDTHLMDYVQPLLEKQQDAVIEAVFETKGK